MNITESSSQKQQAVTIASDMIQGKLCLLEGCKQLASASYSLVPDPIDDTDLVVFIGVSSESDDLPTGNDRQYWSKEALAREEKKIAAYEAKIKDVVIKACNNILFRFSNNH